MLDTPKEIAMAFSMEPIMRLPYFKGKEVVVLGADKKIIFKSISKTQLNQSLSTLEDIGTTYVQGWGFVGFIFDRKQYYIGVKELEDRALVAAQIVQDLILVQQAPNQSKLLEKLLVGIEQWHSSYMNELGFNESNAYELIVCTAENYDVDEAIAALEVVFEDALITGCDQHIALILPKAELAETHETLLQLFNEELMVEPLIVHSIVIEEWNSIETYFNRAKRMLLIGKRLYTSKRMFSVNDLLFSLAIDQASHDDLVSAAKLKNIQLVTDDQELIATVIHFFENNLNVTDTSNKLFIHRNTLLYRLGKIEQLTGYDLRKFEAATNFYYLMTKQLL